MLRLQHNLGAGDSADATMVALLDETNTPVHAEQPVLSPEQQVASLMEGLTDMVTSMVGQFNLNTLMQMVLENIYQTLGLRRVLLMLSGPARSTLLAHTAFGEGAETLVGRLRLPLSGAKDILALVMLQKKDLVITDSLDEKVSKYIPAPFRESLDGRSFLLLPLVIRDRSIGLFYLELAPGTSLDEKVLKAVKALRNQAALAIQQARNA